MANTVQVPVGDLGYFHASLARCLNESGFHGVRLNEIFSTCLRGECSRCGIQVTGAEIELIAVAEESTQGLHPKLQRLQRGFCAREGCESYFYAVHLETHPDVNWETATQEAIALLDATKESARQEESLKATRHRRQRAKRFAAGLLLALALLFSWFAIEHGRLPFIKKKHKYQIDPASVIISP